MRVARFVLALLALSALTAQAAPRYQIIALKMPRGYDASYATCLNDQGQVAGDLVSQKQQSQERHKGSTACLWTNRRMRLLPSIPIPYSHEVYDAVASGINNHGQVIGTLSYFFNGAWMGTDLQAVIWDRHGMTMIPKLNRMDQNTAIAINDAGQVACTADDDFIGDMGSIVPHIFVYAHSQDISLGPGCATGINSHGQISGYVLLDSAGAPTSDTVNADGITQSRAILCTSAGQQMSLGSGYALNLNDSGDVIGTNEQAVADSGTPELRTDVSAALITSTITLRKVFVHGHHVTNIIGPRKTNAARLAHSILWRTGPGQNRSVPLPIHWLPQAINAQGMMVGSHWLWTNGHEYDLNQLIGPIRGWQIICATAINRRGQIAGWGIFHGKNQAFLMMPL